MANTHRGEVDITINGVVYTMRPAFQQLAALEDALKLDLRAFIQQLMKRAPTLREIRAVLIAGLEGGGNSIDNDEVEAFIVACGPMNADLLAAFETFMLRAAGLGGDTEKKPPQVARKLPKKSSR